MNDYKICANQFTKAYTKFGIKMLTPMKNLCLRLLRDGPGITAIHTNFVALAVLEGLAKLAL